MSDDPSDEDVLATSLTSSAAGKRGPRKGAQRGILPIGFVLNGIYEVKRFLARGGMGEVYEGVNVNAEERVAIKVILPHLAADPKVQALFRKEAKTLTSLAHPALVQYRVLAREPRKDLLYIVTDFIDGEPLTNLIGRDRPTTAELAMLIRRLAEGLGAAHDHGAIHRDISPENILLPSGVLSRAKIIDFGIAKSMEIGAQTVVGDGFAGKLGYVAPEQFGDFNRRIGPWTDIYSLGLVALALAGGAAPDMGATLVEAIDRRRAGPDLTSVPPLLLPLFSKMLSPDPRERPQSMGEVIAALDAIDIPVEPPSGLSRPSSGAEPAAEAPPEGEARTIVQLASGQPSWGAAEPTPVTEAPAPVAESAAAPPRTIFAPSTPPQAAPEAAPAAPEPEPPQAFVPTEASPPVEPAPAVEPPADAARTIFAPKVEAPAPAAPAPETPKADEKPAAPKRAKADKPPPPPPPPSEPAAAVAAPASAPKPKPEPKAEKVEKAAVAAGPTPPRKTPTGVFIAAGVAAVAVIGAGVVFLAPHKKPAQPGGAAAPAAAPPASMSHAEEAIATALPSVPCSWLTMNRSQNPDGSANVKIAGTAGDPAAVNKAVASAAQAAGAAGLQVDTTEVLPAKPALCPLLDTVRTFRDQRPAAVPGLVAQQTRFEIDRGIQGCPKGLWAQSMIQVAPDPSKSFTLIAVQPSGKLQQFAATREQFASLAARNPNLYKDLGGGRYRVSMCQSELGLSGVLMIEGAAPFDIGLPAGAMVRPPADFTDRLRKLGRERGWTMQMAWFQLVNEQPDLPEQASPDDAARHQRELAAAAEKAAAEKAAAEQAAAAPAQVETPAPAAEPQKLPADYSACRRFVNGAWEELGYASRAACTEKVFNGRCDVLSGQSGDVALRRYGDRLQAKTGKGFSKWANVGKSDCPQ